MIVQPHPSPHTLKLGGQTLEIDKYILHGPEEGGSQEITVYEAWTDSEGYAHAYGSPIKTVPIDGTTKEALDNVLIAKVAASV